MKILSIILGWLILLTESLSGQNFVFDNQWLIKDGIGKNGIGSSLINVYPVNNTINGSSFTLDSVKHPQIESPQLKRNDLFIIYDDWNYFNSRDMDASSYNINFFRPVPSTVNNRTHNFSSSYPHTIKYAYLSNIYEDDDTPGKVKASNMVSGNGATTYTFQKTLPVNVLTANHSVRINKDITLILKITPEVQNLDTILINQLIVGNTIVYYNLFFEPSNIFNNNTKFSNLPIQNLGNGKLLINGISPGGPPFIFINLRPTDSTTYYLSKYESFGLQAKFTIKKRDSFNNIPPLTEGVSYFHDPNFIEVKSICKNNRGEEFITYHVEFENNGSTLANNLLVKLSGFSKYLDENCISEVKYFVGDQEVGGKRPRAGELGFTVFEYNNNVKLLPCTPGDKKSCIGYIDFCIKIIKPGLLADTKVSLQPDKAVVLFDGKENKIEQYNELKPVFVLVGPSGEYRRPVLESDCKCACQH